VVGTGALAAGGLVGGVMLAPVTGGGSLYGYFSALVGGGIGGGIGINNLNNYHPFGQYIAKPHTQQIFSDWRQKNPMVK